MSLENGLRYDDIYRLCENKLNLHSWLRAKGLIGDFQGQSCDKCSVGTYQLVADRTYPKDGLVWRCKRKNCQHKATIRKGSWFAGSHLELTQILKLTYYWVYRCGEQFVKRELSIASNSTIVDWYNFAREVCVTILEKDSQPIGGPGKVVEIDESKFGKRKYHRGRRVDGVWVFGGIERDSKKLFMVTVPDRSAATLIPIIKSYIIPGTKVLSDCWKSYDKLAEEGYIHGTVNHSVEFVNSETGDHTQTIESTWRAVKRSLPRSGSTKALYDSYFAEFIFRRHYLEEKDDKFLAFLEQVKRIYVPGTQSHPTASVNTAASSPDSTLSVSTE